MKTGISKQFALIILLIFSMVYISGCSAPKEAAERRNLMMPRKDELPRNKKYRMVEKRKTYKVNKKHNRRR
ncbi:MAG: hypothetical protein JXB00_18620 [Bacteroidales bacterium]|nr:hypothetical protein [Bacteroidales bacterium]